MTAPKEFTIHGAGPGAKRAIEDWRNEIVRKFKAASPFVQELDRAKLKELEGK